MAVTACIDSVPCRVDSCAHERGVEKVKLPPNSNSVEFDIAELLPLNLCGHLGEWFGRLFLELCHGRDDVAR